MLLLMTLNHATESNHQILPKIVQNFFCSFSEVKKYVSDRKKIMLPGEKKIIQCTDFSAQS